MKMSNPFFKFFLRVLILFIIAVTVFRWLILFIFAGLSLPFLLLTGTINIHFANLSDLIKIGFLKFKFNIYPTPFPLVSMDPEFTHNYRNFRLFLIYFADILSFAFFIVMTVKLAPHNFKAVFRKNKPKWLSLKNPRFVKISLAVFTSIIILIIILIQTLILPASHLYSSTKVVVSLSKEAVILLRNRDFPETEKKLIMIKEELNISKKYLQDISWLGEIPFISNYYHDAESLFATAGYAIDSGLTATDILPTLNSGSLENFDQFSPRLGEILNNFSLAKKEIDNIDPNRYPKKIAGKEIRKEILLVKNSVEEFDKAKQEFQPLLSVAPDLIGTKKTRRYLVLFQDDNRLGPIGGTITAFGIFKIDKGKVFPEESGDITELNRTRYNLIPQNTSSSPDFVESMKSFKQIYRNSYQGGEIDGIIAIDGEFFVNLVTVLGPTPVYDNILSSNERADCSCPAIIADIGKLVDENRKKDIIGIFLNALLVKTYSSPVKTQFEVLLAVSKSAREKHLLVYFDDLNEQKAATSAAISGRIIDESGDYLYISEANFSEIREDRYLKRTVEDKTEIKQNGEILKTISLTYQKPIATAKTSTLVLRFYLPKGTEVLESNTSKEKTLMAEDLGKTVLETSVDITSKREQTIILKYRLPTKASGGEHKLFRQKQPGVKGYEYTLFLNGEKQQSLFLENDQEILLTIH